LRMQSLSQSARLLTSTLLGPGLTSRLQYSKRIHLGNVSFVVVDGEKRGQKKKNDLLGQDPKYPLPGDVVCASQFDKHNEHMKEMELDELADELAGEHSPNPQTSPAPTEAGENLKKAVVNSKLPTTDLRGMLERLLVPTARSDSYVPAQAFMNSTTQQPAPKRAGSEKPQLLEQVELKAYHCPDLLRLEMRHQLPELGVVGKEIILLSLEHPVEFSATTSEMEAQRLRLSFNFVDAASAICESLQVLGYWADFIDPRSGKPYYHREVTQKPFDHDERYQRLGYKLLAEGACNVLSNVRWDRDGHFVGTIFTSAPLNSTVIKGLLEEVNQKGEEK